LQRADHATFVTLLLVPVVYSIFVLDLKLIKWESLAAAEPRPAAELTTEALHYPHWLWASFLDRKD